MVDDVFNFPLPPQDLRCILVDHCRPLVEFGSNKEVQFSDTSLAEVVIEGGEKGLGES